jgi:hypothetical protein
MGKTLIKRQGGRVIYLSVLSIGWLSKIIFRRTKLAKCMFLRGVLEAGVKDLRYSSRVRNP